MIGHPDYSVMGPAVCQHCGALVWWARSRTRLEGQTVPTILAWHERGGAIHRPRCERRAA